MRYLAEFYLPNGGSGLAELASRAEAAARRVPGPDGAVTFLSAIYLPDDESCFAIYEAESMDLVLAAGTLAGLEFDHVAPISVCEADAPESRH
ncbi:MAG TPA: hypothetical protein VFI65_27505 [Streptosporangiaceae bacterium]|nr:hypothetical protein [Streptosporangiaceae bacterium]